MDPITHTIIVMISLYIAFRVGRHMRRKSDIEKYTMYLEEQGFVHIKQMRDGSYEFIKHWQHQE